MTLINFFYEHACRGGVNRTGFFILRNNKIPRKKCFSSFTSVRNKPDKLVDFSSAISPFSVSTRTREVEHYVDGISFIIKDNSDLYKNEISNIPVVLIHGCYGSKKNFRSFSKLIKSNKIIIIDLRNHGNSLHSNNMKYEDIENDIKNVINKLKGPLNFDTCCLTGFSIGGKVAMYSALKNPDLFSKLIVMDILPFNYYKEGGNRTTLPYNIIKMSKTLLHIKKEKNPKNKQEFLAYFKEAEPTVADTFAQFLCTSLKENEEKTNLFWKINIEAIYNNIKHLTDFPLDYNIYKYRNPCSFIIGSNSDLAYGIPNFENVINNFFPKSQKFLLKGSSHLVYVEQPEQCAKIINDIINA